MNCKKLIMLCDYGLDDAIATAYILENADKFEFIDIVPIAGNFPLETSFKNAKTLLSYYNSVKNVRLVDTSALNQPFEELVDIHGNDGMGDILEPKNDGLVEILSYSEWIKTVDTNCILLSLGPCTVTLEILKSVESIPLIMMAGNIAEPPNYNGYEFNHGMDIKAFAECAKYRHVTATLDTGNNPVLDFYKVSLNNDTVLAQLISASVKLSLKRKEEIASVYDLCAAYYLINPSKFEIENMTDKDGNKLSVLKYIDTDFTL